MSSTRPHTESAQVHVSLQSEDKESSSLRVTGRAPTHLGDQGDHVSAHQLIINAAHTLVNNASLDIAFTKAFHLLDILQSKTSNDLDKLIAQRNEYISSERDIPAHVQELMPQLIQRNSEFDSIIEEAKEKINNYRNNAADNSNLDQSLSDLFTAAKKDNEFTAKYKNCDELEQNIKQALIKSNSLAIKEKLENDVIKIITQYLTVRNKLPFTAFPVEGNIKQPPGEGARVRRSARKLKAIEIDLSDNMEKIEENAADYPSYTQDIAASMFELFWYPKIPVETLIDLNTASGRKKWEGIMQDKKYNQGTRPRDNNLETLYEVTANHIDLVLTCHPHFSFHPDFISQLTRDFVELVARKGKICGIPLHWAMDESQTVAFYIHVMDNLRFLHNRNDDLSQDWDSRSTSRRSSAYSNDSGNLTPTDLDSSPNTRAIMEGLTTPSGSHMTLARLVHPDAATPQSTASDSSYRPDDNDSPEHKNSPPRRSRRLNPSTSEVDDLAKSVGQIKFNKKK